MTAAAIFSEADRERAELLIAEIRAGFVNIERKTIELIEMRGWVALGYRTFEQMWNDRLRGIRIATDAMKAHVVYALLDTATPEGAAASTGISAEIIDAVADQKANGIPPKLAIVRRHERQLPTPPDEIHIEVSRAEYLAWSRMAKRRGLRLDEMCLSVLRERLGAKAHD